jgi:hypothetical protein
MRRHKVYLSFFFLLLIPAFLFGKSQDVALLRGLDKVTGRVYDLKVPVGKSVRFGTLEIIVHYVDQTLEAEIPETTVFLEIKETKNKDGKDGPCKTLFSSWMFASSPGVSALEHPTYDVWVSPRQGN